jgi:hypothetical protein
VKRPTSAGSNGRDGSEALHSRAVRVQKAVWVTGLILVACGAATDPSDFPPLIGPGGVRSVSTGGFTFGTGGFAGVGAQGTGGYIESFGGSPGGDFPGTGGELSSGGVFEGTGGVGGCCAALPSCDDGDINLGSPACPPESPGLDCYQRTTCCTTVTCLSKKQACPPTCPPLFQQVASCLPGVLCSIIFGCGESVNCAPYAAVDAGPPIPPPTTDASIGCNPTTDFERHYLSDPPDCASAYRECPAYTSYFSNACGCGCEQASTCPPYSYASLVSCPYTTFLL